MGNVGRKSVFFPKLSQNDYFEKYSLVFFLSVETHLRTHTDKNHRKNWRKRQTIFPNVLRMRIFLSKLANNSPIFTKIFSFWEGWGGFSVFFSWFFITSLTTLIHRTHQNPPHATTQMETIMFHALCHICGTYTVKNQGKIQGKIRIPPQNFLKISIII